MAGTSFGCTNDAASIRRAPAATARSMSSTFALVSSSARSFCRPSRGLTSTIPATTGAPRLDPPPEPILPGAVRRGHHFVRLARGRRRWVPAGVLTRSGTMADARHCDHACPGAAIGATEARRAGHPEVTATDGGQWRDERDRDDDWWSAPPDSCGPSGAAGGDRGGRRRRGRDRHRRGAPHRRGRRRRARRRRPLARRRRGRVRGPRAARLRRPAPPPADRRLGPGLPQGGHAGHDGGERPAPHRARRRRAGVGLHVQAAPRLGRQRPRGHVDDGGRRRRREPLPGRHRAGLGPGGRRAPDVAAPARRPDRRRRRARRGRRARRAAARCARGRRHLRPAPGQQGAGPRPRRRRRGARRADRGAPADRPARAWARDGRLGGARQLDLRHRLPGRVLRGRGRRGHDPRAGAGGLRRRHRRLERRVPARRARPGRRCPARRARRRRSSLAPRARRGPALSPDQLRRRRRGRLGRLVRHPRPRDTLGGRGRGRPRGAAPDRHPLARQRWAGRRRPRRRDVLPRLPAFA